MKHNPATILLAVILLMIAFASHAGDAIVEETAMSANKLTVHRYMEAFGRSDHEGVLACLTEDVEWDIPGAFHVVGKAAFDGEIENEAFVGRPTITVTRLTEENDVVVAEGHVRCARKDGGMLNAVFCDVFEMRNGKIKRLVSYLMEIKDSRSSDDISNKSSGQSEK